MCLRQEKAAETYLCDQFHPQNHGRLRKLLTGIQLPARKLRQEDCKSEPRLNNLAIE